MAGRDPDGEQRDVVLDDWLDDDHPSPDLVLGKLFLRIPQGGKVLSAATSPVGVALVAAVGIAFLGAAQRPRSRHAARREHRRPALRAPAFPAPIRASARQVALIAGVVAPVAAVGGVVLLAMPTTQASSRTLHVVQQG